MTNLLQQANRLWPYFSCRVYIRA